MKRDSRGQTLILCAFGLIPVVWAALLTAPALSGGLLEILTGLTAALNNPLAVTWCEDSVKTVLIFIIAYVMGIGIYLSTRRNTRPKEEHGSAKWV
jgi:type IV secretion system protein VirD4